MKTGILPVPQTEAADSFELYSTLAGKMARMEELLNRIDRFLGDAAFRDRICSDAEEFYQLVNASRGLYPEKLDVQDHPKYDQAIDRTVAVSKELLTALRAENMEAAREALETIGRQRVKAHAEFSR